MAVICDWSDNNTDIRIIAEDIGKVSSPNYVPSIIPFGAQRAVLFCSSPTVSSQIAELGPIHTQGSVVVLNGWHELVSTIEPLKAKFEGWISVWGLPFHCGTKNALAASAARVKD